MSLTELDVLVEKLDATKNGTLVISKSQGTMGCTPNGRVPMVFSWCSLGILGDNLPINTHYIGLI